jgi:hypothetical protein
MRLTWLVDAAAETGYPAVVVDGWEGRGYSDGYNPSTVVAHHTAGPSGNGDMPSLGVIVNGRKDLAGPLANYGLGRSGAIYVVASGKSNNAGEGDWDGCDTNYCTVGIEAENDGYQPWPTAQLDAYAKLSAAIIKRLGWDASQLCGHKEWAPGRKVDPHTINMNRARAAVADLLNAAPPSDEEDALTPAEFAGQLNVDKINALVTAKVAGTWVIAPTDANRQHQANYWAGKLPNPSDPEWADFYRAVLAAGQVAAAIG